MSMIFTLTCDCGAEVETTGDTFAEVSAAAEALGWSTDEPACPKHTPIGSATNLMDGGCDA